MIRAGFVGCTGLLLSPLVISDFSLGLVRTETSDWSVLWGKNFKAEFYQSLRANQRVLGAPVARLVLTETEAFNFPCVLLSMF